MFVLSHPRNTLARPHRASVALLVWDYAWREAGVTSLNVNEGTYFVLELVIITVGSIVYLQVIFSIHACIHACGLCKISFLCNHQLSKTT
ncbi:hypothetical protein HanIR_Chr07g0324301 [Helianthus annuus]|nr:hypothetical protein HanIR_Chr07g0324301 [Helianthus annuus]